MLEIIILLFLILIILFTVGLLLRGRNFKKEVVSFGKTILNIYEKKRKIEKLSLKNQLKKKLEEEYINRYIKKKRKNIIIKSSFQLALAISVPFFLKWKFFLKYEWLLWAVYGILTSSIWSF